MCRYSYKNSSSNKNESDFWCKVHMVRLEDSNEHTGYQEAHKTVRVRKYRARFLSHQCQLLNNSSMKVKRE